MGSPKVSVIIPAYNGAQFLGETIQSVLGQTYSNFELIIVDDASPDNTAEVVKRFDDIRLKYIVHEKNKGSDVARDTGLRASCGEFIAFLDQDDLFHPEKLAVHVNFMALNPDIGVTYNPRFNLNHSSMTVRDMWCPPRTVTLSDMVLSFPFAPSDVVLRREWAVQMDLLNGSLSWCGGEIIHYGGLCLSGCRFASVGRALNYRRYHSGRIIKDLVGGCKSEIYAQDKILYDPRCPAEVTALHNLAHANFYMSWAYHALAQGETSIGQGFLTEAYQLKPSIIEGMPCELVHFFLMCSIDDETLDHETILKRVFTQLPLEMSQISGQINWAIARGYLLKSLRALIWDRSDDGRRYYEQAKKLKAPIDDPLIRQLTHNLLDIRTQFGDIHVQEKILALKPYFVKHGGRASLRLLISSYLINRAFESYRAGEYRQVPKLALRAIANNPRYLLNRGVLSIFLRSILKMRAESKSVRDEV